MIEPATATWAAIIAIFAWPIVAAILYSTRPSLEATLWTLLGGLLLLPASFAVKIPMIPALDKNNIPNLCAFIACLSLAKPSPRMLSRLGIPEAFAVLYVICPILTSTYNNDGIFVGGR